MYVKFDVKKFCLENFPARLPRDFLCCYVLMYFCSGLLQVVVQQFSMNWSRSQVDIPQLADMHMLKCG